MAQELLALHSGRSGSSSEESVDVVREHWRSAGADVAWVAAEQDEELHRVLAERGSRTVVVLGGDGSLHRVVAALDQMGALADTAVGLVPLGTGNDLARGVGIPLEPPAAAPLVLTGRPTPMDLLRDESPGGRTDTGIALNAVNLGIGARASERAAGLKPVLGPLGYAAGAVAAGATEDGWALRVSVDGEEVAGAGQRILHVVIGNGSSLGGGAEATPDADPSDSRADVLVSTAVGGLDRVAYARDLARGTHLDRDDVRHVRGCEVVVTGDPHPWNADGEIGTERPESRWRVDADAWHLVC